MSFGKIGDLMEKEIDGNLETIGTRVKSVKCGSSSWLGSAGTLHSLNNVSLDENMTVINKLTINLRLRSSRKNLP